MAETWTSTGHGCILVFGDTGTDSAAAPVVIQALEAIWKTPSGLELIKGITNSRVAVGKEGGYKVKIYTPATVGQLRLSFFGNCCKPARTDIPSRSAVMWDPNSTSTPQGERPAFIGLAHELIHAYHFANGVAKQDYDAEEDFAIGLIPYATNNITENKIRAENNLPPRASRGADDEARNPDDKAALEKLYKLLND
jgi:hypothetical protein